MIDIVPFSSQHADSVVSVILPIQQIEFEIPITLDAQPDLRDIPGFYRQGNGNFRVALDDGKIVGTVALLGIGNTQAALRKMFVSTVDGVKYHVIHRWRCLSLSSLIFTLF